jgi:acetolactate synthase-1/3 small subunit
MNETIHVHFDRSEGSLLRIIGLIERRGFHIDSMQVDEHDQATRRLAVHVRGRDAGRCPEVLRRQIDRLYGVRRIVADAPSPMSMHREPVVCAMQ